MSRLVCIVTTALLVGLSTASTLAVRTKLVLPTPSSAVQCQSMTIDWVGGIHNDVRTALFVDNVTNRSVSWNTNVPHGHSAVIEVSDAKGGYALTEPFVIKASDDATCLH
ncbi:hypothetical protein C8Q80DRAFT_1301792 [Daedaleopsis nitida]|nr:hypothetical protein C8Q80DRAFT_1301792 [Daedaleopsis nitida]